MTALTECDEEVELVMLVAVREYWNKGLPPVGEVLEKKELVDYYNSASISVFDEVNKTLQEDMDIVLSYIQQFHDDGYFGIADEEVPWKRITNAGRGRVFDLQNLICAEGCRLLKLYQGSFPNPSDLREDIVTHTHLTGIAGIRDPDNECTMFKPGNPGSDEGQPPDCQGDGHYLCKSCMHYIDPEVHNSIRSKTTVR